MRSLVCLLANCTKWLVPDQPCRSCVLTDSISCFDTTVTVMCCRYATDISRGRGLQARLVVQVATFHMSLMSLRSQVTGLLGQIVQVDSFLSTSASHVIRQVSGTCWSQVCVYGKMRFCNWTVYKRTIRRVLCVSRVVITGWAIQHPPSVSRVLYAEVWKYMDTWSVVLSE